MGNNNNQVKTSINLKEWKLSYIKCNNLSIYNNPTTHQNIQQHVIYAKSQSQLRVLLQCYSRRLQKKENVVELKGFYCQQCQLSCSNVPVILLYIEHLPKKLIQIKTLQENEALRILNQILIGFKNLYNDKGFFVIEQKMIFFNEKNIIKVWCNQILSKNYANSILIQESIPNQQNQMIKTVIQLIQSKVKKKQIIQRIFMDIKQPFQFQVVLQELNKYVIPVKNKMQKLKMKFPLNKNSVEVKKKIKNFEEGSIDNDTGKIKLIKFIKESNKLSIKTDKSDRKKKITIISQYANNNKTIVSSRQRLTKNSGNSSVNKNNTINLFQNQQNNINQKINIFKKVLQNNQIGQKTSYQPNNYSNKTKKIESLVTKNELSVEIHKSQSEDNRKKKSNRPVQKQQIYFINKLKLKDPNVDNIKINSQNKSNQPNVQLYEKNFTRKNNQKNDMPNYHFGKYQSSNPAMVNYQYILDQIKNKQQQKNNQKQSNILGYFRNTNNVKIYSSYQNKKYKYSNQKFNNKFHQIKKNQQQFINENQSKSSYQKKFINCKQFNYENNINMGIGQNKYNKIISQVNQDIIYKVNSKLNQNYSNLKKKNIDNQQINININYSNIKNNLPNRINQNANQIIEQNCNLNPQNHKLLDENEIERFNTQHIYNLTNPIQKNMFNIQKEISQENFKKNQKDYKNNTITSKFFKGNKNQKKQITTNQKVITSRFKTIQYFNQNHNFSLQMNPSHINYKNQNNINHPYSNQMNKNKIRKQFTCQNQSNQIKSKCNFKNGKQISEYNEVLRNIKENQKKIVQQAQILNNVHPECINQGEIIQQKYNINTYQKIQSKANMTNKVYIDHCGQKYNNVNFNKNQQFYYKNPNTYNYIHPQITNNNFAPFQQKFQFKHTNPKDNFVIKNDEINIENNLKIYQNGLKKSIIIDNNNNEFYLNQNKVTMMNNYNVQSVGHLSSDLAEERMSIYIFQDQI